MKYLILFVSTAFFLNYGCKHRVEKDYAEYELEEKQKEIVDNYAMSVTEAGRFKTGGTWPLNSEPALKGSAQKLASTAAISQTMMEWMLKMPRDGSPTRRPWQRIT